MQEWVQTKGLVNKSQLEGFPQVEDNDFTVAQLREALKPRGYYGDYRYKPMEGALSAESAPQEPAPHREAPQQPERAIQQPEGATRQPEGATQQLEGDRLQLTAAQLKG
jgi:hypothetical protein